MSIVYWMVGACGTYTWLQPQSVGVADVGAWHLPGRVFSLWRCCRSSVWAFPVVGIGDIKLRRSMQSGIQMAGTQGLHCGLSESVLSATGDDNL